MVAAEIDWGITTGPGMAVQFQLSGNSPVAFSQIVAMQVDNTSNSSDVQFLFPDSSYTLVVPAYTQITTPVFTNALQFYVFSPGAVAADRTVFQAFNSVPPPVAVQRSEEQVSLATTGVLLAANAVTHLIPLTVSGTVTGVQMLFYIPVEATAETAACALQDGTGAYLWEGNVGATAGATQNFSVNLTAVRLGFNLGLTFVVSGTTLGAGAASVNVYYQVP
jgi:hypothetical protein